MPLTGMSTGIPTGDFYLRHFELVSLVPALILGYFLPVRVPNADAQVSLGGMYENGEAVPQDYARAAYWYRKAAEHVLDFGGAGQGRNSLGLLYMEGNGAPRDYVQAYMWFSLTASGPNLSQARSQMTSDQISKAEQLAAEWKRHHPER